MKMESLTSPASAQRPARILVVDDEEKNVKLMRRILVVDDEEKNVKLMRRILEAGGYTVDAAGDGAEALDRAQRHPPDLVLLDIMMPVMDGFEVARELKQRSETHNVPIIMVTALEDRQSRLRGLSAGAEEFVTKPVEHTELLVRVKNLLRIKEYGDFLANHNRILEQQVAERTAQLSESYREAIHTLMRAAEYRDDETGAHVRRISRYCHALAERLGMDADFKDEIFYASPMHDIGKIGIPDAILLKPGGLTPAEWKIMQAHTTLGAQILKLAVSPYLHMGADIALSHHEHWDGSGYPQGLKGEAIPLPARIMQVCDVYDALRSPRPYKPAFEHDKSLDIILKGNGRTRPEHFDPAVLAVFRSATETFRGIYEGHADE